MSDDVGNVSLQTTIDETQEENSSGIDERSELDEEKNESEIVNINFLGCFLIKHISRSSNIFLYLLEKHANKIYKITIFI